MIASLMCCVNIDSSNEWLGLASTVVVALVGLCSGVIIAKLSSHLELKKMLCLRKVEVYEAAMRQLVLKINVYANFFRKACLSSSGVYTTRAALRVTSKIYYVGPARGGCLVAVE